MPQATALNPVHATYFPMQTSESLIYQLGAVKDELNSDNNRTRIAVYCNKSSMNGMALGPLLSQIRVTTHKHRDATAVW